MRGHTLTERYHLEKECHALVVSATGVKTKQIYFVCHYRGHSICKPICETANYGVRYRKNKLALIQVGFEPKDL